LTSMSREGVSFEQALAAAQKLGYAEPDPTNDVEGIDAAYKLSILATLSFHMDVRPDDVHREGITNLTERDFAYARELGYAIKLLAIARKSGDRVQLRVPPTLVSQDALLASVDGVPNGVEIDGEISIASVIQKEVDGEGTTEIVIMTHDAPEDAMRSALATIAKLDGVRGIAQMLRVKP